MKRKLGFYAVVIIFILSGAIDTWSGINDIARYGISFSASIEVIIGITCVLFNLVMLSMNNDD